MTFEEWKETLGCSIKFEDEATERTAYLFADIAWQACAERKNAIIEDLKNEKNAIIKTQKSLLKTRFNEGLQVGLEGSKRTLVFFNQAKENYLNENEKLTNELLRLEMVIEQQTKELEALRNLVEEFIYDRGIGGVMMEYMTKNGFLDENGNRTKLLIGEK